MRPEKDALDPDITQLSGWQREWVKAARAGIDDEELAELCQAATDIPSPTELYGATNYIRNAPTCPQGGTYTLGQVQRKPTCTIPGHTL